MRQQTTSLFVKSQLSHETASMVHSQKSLLRQVASHIYILSNNGENIAIEFFSGVSYPSGLLTHG